ncbi:MAG: hypothetical protein GY716_19440 [bacterium]|nr:hypothetical protein [bacterium]
MNDNEPIRLDCRRARELGHRSLDGESLAAAERETLDGHIAVCDECRDMHAELRTIQGALRSMAPAPLADEALDEVWDRTVRRRAFSGWDWRHAAAAALLFVTTVAMLWTARGLQPADEPTEAEIAQAAAEVRMVLGLTGRALERSERAALRGMRDGVAPALSKIPIRLPSRVDAEPAKDGDGV